MTSAAPVSRPSSYTVDEHHIDGRDGEVLVRDYRPEEARARTPFLWVHGGGFSSGGLDQKESDAPARALAESGVRVRTLHYRLAPRANPWRDPKLVTHPGRYPAAHHDTLDAALSLIEEADGPITIGGASAGANIAAGVTLRLRDDGATMPRSVVLAYGTLHAELPPDDGVEGDLRGILAKWAFNPAMLWRMNVNYTGDPALLVPGYAFPGGADVRDFPPTLILDSRNDRLRRSGHGFATELRQAGTDVREVLVDATHGFLNSPRSAAYARGLQEIAAWLGAHD